jgi:hypothetical protein
VVPVNIVIQRMTPQSRMTESWSLTSSDALFLHSVLRVDVLPNDQGCSSHPPFDMCLSKRHTARCAHCYTAKGARERLNRAFALFSDDRVACLSRIVDSSRHLC